jgi:hypothetical protein
MAPLFSRFDGDDNTQARDFKHCLLRRGARPVGPSLTVSVPKRAGEVKAVPWHLGRTVAAGSSTLSLVRAGTCLAYCSG